ncbi:MAG: hypothetical protein Q7V20_10890 [Aquabacterium sp.]|uniref:hypothetical protein n=1 Tax=Aquabacterium sp. TaxID=1872578 RepID=UPI0027220EAC|nr:hypothetical protein [Aquabacterium sp.]MDO9003948.1 hypothetical protein [Aquabacterium sp.]
MTRFRGLKKPGRRHHQCQRECDGERTERHPAPSGAVKCASQNGACALPAGKTATVWFGAWSSYKVRTGLSGKVACNTGTFGGDPIWYLSKACYYVSN